MRGYCLKVRRCTGFPDDLDTGGPLRSREHLDVLFEETTPGIMWDQYGVVADVLVSISRRPFVYLTSLL